MKNSSNRKFKIAIILCTIAVCLMNKINAQTWMYSPYLNINGPEDEWKRFNFYEIQKAYNAYEEEYRNQHPEINLRTDITEEDEDALPGSHQYRRWEYFMFKRAYPSGDITIVDQTWDKFQGYMNSQDRSSQRLSQMPAINWTSLGPSSTNNGNFRPYVGRVNFVKFHPQNNNDIWIGSPTGGLWHSTNGGNSWSTNTDQLASLLTSDLAIDPSNPNVMYVATGDCDAYARSIGVLKSTDGGQTWNTTGLSFNLAAGNGVRINRLLINPLKPSTLFAVSSRGIFRTYDGGTNWTWMITSGDYTDIKYKPGDTTVIYTAKVGTFYISTDGGNTFNSNTAGPLTGINTGKFFIGVTPANPSVVYLLHVYGANFNGLFRSTDNGNTFTLQSNSPNITGAQGYFCAALAVNPANASDVYVAGLSYYRSTDAGVTWTPMNGTNTHVDVHRIEFLPGSSTTLFACNDGGIIKSTDNGTSPWIDLTPGLSISQIYRLSTSATNPDMILAGHQDNGTTLLNSSGWRTVGGGDGTTNLIDHTNPDIAFVSTASGTFYKTTSATSTFSYSGPLIQSNGTGVNAKGPFCTPITMHPTDHNTLLVGKNEVYRSIDGGASWTAMPGVSIPSNPFFAFGIEYLAYAPSNPNYIYAVNFQKVFVSTDGNTFIDRSHLRDSTNLLTGIAVSSTNPQHIWICNGGYSGRRVNFSSDAGLTWTDYSAGLPDIPCNAIVYYAGSQDGLFLAMDIGVYYRDATMSSWQLINTGLPNARVFDLSIQYSSRKLRAALYGRGVWETDIQSVGIEEISTTSTANIYPNPSTGHARITLHGQWPLKNCKLNVFDALGKEIFVQQFTSPTMYLDTESWPSGVYYAKISEGNDVLTQKLVVQ